MLAEERRNRILERLSRDGQVLSAELMRDFAVSEDTVRRDLKDLADAGRLKKVHGGAVLVAPVPYDYEARQLLNVDAKSAIAQRAAQLLKNNMLVFIDGSSTSAQLARHIPSNLKAKFVTHSIASAAELARAHTEVILLGGKIDPELLVSTGPQLLEQAKQFRPDLSIISVNGLSVTDGATVQGYEDSLVTAEFVRNSAETAVLAGHEKLKFVAHYKVADISDLDYLITDAEDADLLEFQRAGLTVWRAV